MRFLRQLLVLSVSLGPLTVSPRGAMAQIIAGGGCTGTTLWWGALGGALGLLIGASAANDADP